MSVAKTIASSKLDRIQKDADHAVLSPSSMERWINCKAAPRLCRGLVSTTSAAAEEGTFAHLWAERFCRYQILGQTGQYTTNEFGKLEKEMREAIFMYFETISDDMKPGCILYLEVKLVDLKEIHPHYWGTADAVLWNPKTRVLRVYDFKYGKGHIVKVEGNPQLLTYALGAVLTLGYPALTIEIVVVQPRSPRKNKISRWGFDAFEILEFEAFAAKATKATEDPNAEAVVGDWCYFCPARTQGCPAHKEKKAKKADDAFADVVLEVDDDDENHDPFA